MSAFLVSKRHIDFLVSAGLTVSGGLHGVFWFGKDPLLTDETADRVGQLLWNENQESFNARYREADETPTYRFERFAGKLDPVWVLKAIACYEYQSCDHERWETSYAKDFCEVLRSRVISELPGYDKAPWGITDGVEAR